MADSLPALSERQFSGRYSAVDEYFRALHKWADVKSVGEQVTMRDPVFICGIALLLSCTPAAAQAPAPPGLIIEKQVVLKQAKVVMNMDHLAFDGETPFGISYMKLMLERFAADRTDFRIVAIFHGPAGYMLLNDDAYNKLRKSKSGNPYKDDIAALKSGGVDVEECGQTMREHGWVNAELLPGIVVNSGANFRIIELVQEGFVQIQP